MATRRGIGEFSGESADWESYIGRLENYFVAQSITDAGKQRATLTWSCHLQTDLKSRSITEAW